MSIYTRTTSTQNAGYILLDLDCADTGVLQRMRDHGHHPCLVLQTSPGHLQARVHVSTWSPEPCIATTIGRQLARAYGGDPASADWRHLGRLAGFTNQKPARRTIAGYAPWVKIVHARAGLALRPARWWSLPEHGVRTASSPQELRRILLPGLLA